MRACKNSLKSDDIILIYLKGKENGFIGIAQTEEEMRPNKNKISIFRDTNINKNIVKIKTIVSFETIKLSAIKNVFEDHAKFTNLGTILR